MSEQFERLKATLADRYSIQRELGSGGMATVYLAEDLKHRRKVAVKVLRPELAATLGPERFLREIEIAAQLTHPHILPLFDSGEASGFLYYVMPYIGGESLRDRLEREENLSIDDGIRLTDQVASALTYAHEQGVVHRDIKPENILLAGDQAIVADFGIARAVQVAGGERLAGTGLAIGTPENILLAGDQATVADFGIARAVQVAGGERLTGTGLAIGTPAYMSPEQAMGQENVDGRCDVYALGCVVYEMVSGRPPFEGSTAQVLLAKHAADAVPGLRASDPAIPVFVERAVEKALAKDPADRFETPSAFAEALTTQRVVARIRQLARLLGLAAVLAVLLAVTTAGLWIRYTRGVAERDSRVLAASAVRRLENADPVGALVLGIEAFRKSPTYEAADALRRALRGPRQVASVGGLEGAAVYASINPRGDRIVTAGKDGIARLWSLETGSELAVLAGHDSGLRQASFSPDGSTIVTAGSDAVARLWDADRGTLLLALEGHEGPIRQAAFGPEGGRLVTAGQDGSARIWDTRTGDQLQVLTVVDAPWVTHASFAPDGMSVLTADSDGWARVWDAASGDERLRLGPHGQALDYATFSPDGRWVATASRDGSARVWDAHSGAEMADLRGHQGPVAYAAFSPNGRSLVTASWDRTARVWSVEGGREQRVLEGHTLQVIRASYSADASTIMTASRDGTVRLWDVQSGKMKASLSADGPVRHASLSPDGTLVVVVGEGGAVGVWEARERDLIAVLRRDEEELRPLAERGVLLLGGETELTSVEFGPQGRRVLAVSRDGTVWVWDLTDPSKGLLVQGPRPWVMHGSFSPDGRRIVTANSDFTARVWDASSGAELVVLRGHSGRVRHASFSQDGLRIVTASEDRTARVWDAVGGDPVSVLGGHSGSVIHASFSGDGVRVVTATSDGASWLWDASSATRIRPLLGGRAWQVSAPGSPQHFFMAVSPSGHRVVTAGPGGEAHVWDAETGHEIAALTGHQGAVEHAQFGPDGLLLVTASADGTARLWAADLGTQLAVLLDQGLPVVYAYFEPDGGRVLTVGADGTVIASPVHPEQLLTIGEQRLPITIGQEERDSILVGGWR